MTRFRPIYYILLILLMGNLITPVHAQTGIRLVSDNTTLTFPESVTFKAEFQGGANITSVVLEYGVDQLTCGTVIAKAFPQVTPAADVQVEWTWEMQESGSLPPGVLIWWQWQVQDANGTQFTSPKKTIVWLDSVHAWQVIPGGNINLHFYYGGQSFGQALHEAAVQALVRLTQDVGLQPEKPVDIYIYANTSDLKDAILYEPAWIGGQAFPENNIVIIGVSPDQLEWGKSTEAHELTHVLVGHLTFSCLGFIPTWLNEGLAVYGEGGPQPSDQTQFDQAKAGNQLLSLRSLAGGFSEESSRATLSYTEAFSVVNFMIKKYGREKMTTLLLALRDGATADEALQTVYGFDTDGLEEAWRASIGAAPRAGAANATPMPTATQVPTIVPVGATPAAPAQVTVTRSEVTGSPSGMIETLTTQTALAAAPTPGPAATSIPLTERLGLNRDMVFWFEMGAIGCILVILLVTITVIGAARRHRRRK